MSKRLRGKLETKSFEFEEVYDKEVVSDGNGGKIPFFKRYIGKKVKVIVCGN